MRFLTLTAPWGSLVALGCKRIETRGWSTPYRGPIAIHQGQGLKPVKGYKGLFKICNQEPFKAPLTQAGILNEKGLIRLEQLHLGHIIAVAELVDVRPIPARLPAEMGYSTPERVYRWPLTEQELAFGDYTSGRFAWLLADVKPLREPLQWQGAQGLRPLPEVVESWVRRRAA